jgi:hypothetical protein
MDPEETAAYRANEPATVKLAMDGTMIESEEKAKANELKERALAAAEQIAGVLAEGQKYGLEVTIGQIRALFPRRPRDINER